MYLTHKSIPLTGLALATALLAGLPQVRFEVSGWSRPGPTYRPDRGNNSIATGNRHGGPHRNLREIARSARRTGAIAA